MGARYDTIGTGYAARRRPDPRIAKRIREALGDARTVVNVGAGAGSYEPDDLKVVAVEPSVVMARQRPQGLLPAVLGVAERLPFADDAVDATMGILTLHHWEDVQAGAAEAIRVSRQRVVFLTIDPAVESAMWLFSGYVPEVAAQDVFDFPAIGVLLEQLGPRARSEVVEVPHDCTDGFLLSFWSHPERVLEQDARRATSGFARLDSSTEERVVARLERDLRSGAWDERHGHLRDMTSYDAGLRLVVAELEAAPAS